MPITPVHDASTFVMERRPKIAKDWVYYLLLLFALLTGMAAALLVPPLLGHRNAPITPTPVATGAHKSTPVSTPKSTHTPTPVVTPTRVVTPTAVITPTPVVTPTPIVTQPSTPIPTGYPGIAGTYNGTIIDEYGPIRGDMSLVIQQQQANIRGNFTVSGGLAGSGPFSRICDEQNYIQFIVQSSDVNPLFFYGTVQANGDLGGNYCSLDATGHCNTKVGGYGTWGVVRGSSG